MEERRSWIQQWIEAQQARQAATAAMEAAIAEMAAEESTEEEEDELTPLQAWWQECVSFNNHFKQVKREYIERYEEAYWNQVENERKAKEYTKNGLDDWLEVLELGIKENMEEEKDAWLKNHKKRLAEKADELNAKRARIEEGNPQAGDNKRDDAPEDVFKVKSMEDALNEIE